MNPQFWFFARLSYHWHNFLCNVISDFMTGLSDFFHDLLLVERTFGWALYLPMFVFVCCPCRVDFKLKSSKFQVTNYELLFITRVTSYFLPTSYELLLIARVTSYFIHVIFYICNYYLLHELWVNIYVRVTSYYLLQKLRL